MELKNEAVLVTGGGGFLGKAIVHRLLGIGCRGVRVFCRTPQPDLQALGVEIFNGDIRDYDAVLTACENRSLIFNTAAKAGVWGDREEYFSINYNGTLNVLKGCILSGVRCLVHTSSPSVALPDGNIENCDENIPYPDQYLAAYPESKAMAEKAVLGEYSSNFTTVALRPHLIWGPGDPHLLPRIIRRARKRKIKIVGDGKNLVDLTYIDNAVEAHIKAAENLLGCRSCHNKAYFISDGKPVLIWDWLNNILKALDIPPIRKSISHRNAYKAGAVMEAVYSVLPFLGEPPMTRFVAGQLAHSHYFNISAAKKDFGYAPVISESEALEKTIAWLRANQ